MLLDFALLGELPGIQSDIFEKKRVTFSTLLRLYNKTRGEEFINFKKNLDYDGFY